MSIEVSHVSKQFDQFKALNDINLNITSGELVTFATGARSRTVYGSLGLSAGLTRMLPGLASSTL